MKKSIALIYLIVLALTAFSQSTKTYEYDALGRLTKTTYSNGVKVFYAYDALGNRVTKTVINGHPEGATSGIFSVGYNKYAYFSQGNLQYRASTNTWRFAEHQWDFVGGEDWDGNVFGNVYETDDQGQQFKCDNGWISETYNGWIDLFGWGTNGYNNPPWSASIIPENYYAYGQEGHALYEMGGMADWGYNAISNGGNAVNSGWRTPTAAEWDYLMNTRHTTSGIRYVFAVVNEVSGMILLPDDWDASVYALNDPNPTRWNMSIGSDYESGFSWLEAIHNSNVMNAATWMDVFEPAGAVFLPCTGSRRGYDYPHFIDIGYWSSSNLTTNTPSYTRSYQSPFFLWYLNGMLLPSDMSVLDENHLVSADGMCVRLIQDIPDMFVVNTSLRQSIGGAVNGEGNYEFGDMCTLEAEAEEGYEFVHWTENGVVVSTEPSYTFSVYTNHQIEAHFRNLEDEDPDLLDGRFSVSEDRVARFAKGNLNLDFQFHESGTPDVQWSFAAHQWDCQDFDVNSFLNDPEGYMDTHSMDLIYQRYLNDVNNNDIKLDFGCWRNLSIEEWQYLLYERVTARGMHYYLGCINNNKGLVLFPDDWDASYYPLSYGAVDVELPGIITEDVVFNEISIDDWVEYFEPNKAVFLPLSFIDLTSSSFNTGFYHGHVTNGNYYTFLCGGLNYSMFYCFSDTSSEYDELLQWLLYYQNQMSGDGYALKRLKYGYERPVQVESRNYEIIGAQPNPLWAGEVNGGGMFETQMRDGEGCTLTATAKSGHTFLGWYENGGLISTDPILSFIVEGSRFIEARYSADVYFQVYAEASPWEGGYVDDGCVQSTGQYEEWQECQLDAEPKEHYHFIGWMENDSIISTSAQYTFVVISDRNLQACFAENQSYILTANAVPEMGGTVFPAFSSISTGHESYFSGEFEETVEVSLMANAEDGYHFVGWMVGDSLVSMDNIYNFTFPSNDIALEAHFELCEVETEPAPDLLSGRFSISPCTMVGFAKGNVICKVEMDENSVSSSWEFAPMQAYRQNHSEGELQAEEVKSKFGNGMDLVPLTMEHEGMLDFSCWHQLSCGEWDYLLKERDIPIRYAFAKVNNVDGLLVMPDDWNPETYQIISPNETGPYETNTISRYDWNTLLEPAGVLFLPANGFIEEVTHNNNIHYAYVRQLDGNAIGFYSNLVFAQGLGGVLTEELAMMMPMSYASIRLAQVVETSSSSFSLTVEASQPEYGTVSGEGNFTCGSSCTVSAIPNNGYVFRYWLDEGVAVSTEAEYTFPLIDNRNLIAEFAAENEVCEVEAQLSYDKQNFQVGWYHNVIVMSTGNGQPELRLTLPAPQIDWYERYITLGMDMTNFSSHGLPDFVSYSVYVGKGDTITVSYEQNEMLNAFGGVMTCDFVLAFAGIDTIVTGNAQEVLPFVFSGNCDLYASHKQPLTNGWNWWSTYVEQEGFDGLTMLENSLGYDGLMIKSRSDGYVESYEYEGTIGWFGPLTSIKNEQMYKIDMNADGRAVIRGLRTETSSHPITINYGWNWIGFPMSQSVAVTQAMSGFSPEPNDVLKGRNGFTTYYSNNGELGWYGTLNILEPGSGYMYQSQSNGIKTLVFQEGRGHATEANITPEGNVYRPNGGRYADNMTVTAVVEVNGEELRSDTYELAAFSGDECRGSVRLMYVEPVDRYVAFLTVFGEQGDDIGFRLTDGTKTLQSPDRIVFVADGISGTLSNPTLLRFGDTGIGEQSTVVRIHPNPVDRDARFTISLPLGEDIEEVIITNALGAVVRHETGALKAVMEGLSTSGVYMVKATCRSGNVYVGRLVVK